MSTLQSEPADWLAHTKLTPPSLRGDRVPRTSLVAGLREAILASRLTLIAAPAGYGKTSLLAELGQEFPSLGLAWLSLDEDDNDPARFLAGLILAIRERNPRCVAAAYPLLTSLPQSSIETRRLISVLINDILEAQPSCLTLVLDDLQRVTAPAIYVALDHLIERLPLPLHLVVAARQEPPLALARLRARRQIAEFRAADLRFTLSETRSLLNDQLRLELTPSQIETLNARTEGWLVGLQLVVHTLTSLPPGPERSRYLSSQTRVNRQIFDFLSEEVLDHQSPALRRFLLETSILPELTPILARAVTGRNDAASVLDDLWRRQIFLVTADEARAAFRYHALFAEFLQDRLAREYPEQVADLHRRAAEAQTDPTAAIAHYLAAHLWEEAALAIEQTGERLIRQGWFATLRDWIEALPSSACDAHPRLLYFIAQCAYHEGRLNAAEVLIERAQRGCEAIGDTVGVGLAVAQLASCTLLRDDLPRATSLIDRGLTLPLGPAARAQLLMGRARLRALHRDWDGGEADLDAALAIGAASANPEVLYLIATNLHQTFVVLPKGGDRIERLCEQADAVLGESITPLHGATEGQRAFALFWRGQLAEAIETGRRAWAILARFGDVYHYGSWTLLEAVLLSHIARRDYAAADQLWATGSAQWRGQGVDDAVIPGLLFQIGHLRWIEGRIEEAQAMLARMEAAAHPDEVPGAPALRGTLRGVLELADRQYATAERTLQNAAELEAKVRLPTVYGSARLHLAYLYLVWNRPNEALVTLEPVLAECQRNRAPGFILKEGEPMHSLLRLAIHREVRAAYATDLLQRFGISPEPQPIQVPDTGEALSLRELEVLRLIAHGASNQDIIKQLVISEPTVKSHVSHIFRKLNVASRTQAVARARQLRIV